MSNIEKIASLLAMAERTDNAAEAEAFMQKAQTLATLHSVDLAVAQSKIAKREQREHPINKQITIGERGKKANKQLINLFIAVAGNNDVQVDIAHNSTYVIAFGMPSDIEVVEAMWGSLAFQMVEAANAYVKAGEWKGETYSKWDRNVGWYGATVEKPHTAVTARNSFYKGYTHRISERLAAARRDALAQAEEAERAAAALSPTANNEQTSTESGTALVLKGKTEEIAAYYKKASTARGKWRGSASSADNSGRAARAGRDAASNARLSANKGISGTRGSVTA